MSSIFEREPGFCPHCGTILPLIKEAGGVTCYLCKNSYGPEGKRIAVQLLDIFT